MSDEVYDFGLRLKKFREAEKLTQAAVAKRLGVTAATVNKYENNTLLPPVDKLEAMAILYKTSLDYLRNLDKRACIYIDDLAPAQQATLRSVVGVLKAELVSYDRGKQSNG